MLLEVLKILSQPNDIGSIIKVALSRKNRIKPKDFVDTALTIFKKEVPNDEQDYKNMRDSFSLKMSCYHNDKRLSTMIPEFSNFTDDVFSLNTYEAGYFAALHCSPCIPDNYSPVAYDDD